nr:PhF00028.1 [Neoporphyra haitanensis]
MGTPRGAIGLAAATLLLLTALVPCVTAHSSLILPKERTYETACRVGGMQSNSQSNCSGPCPTREPREYYSIQRLRRGRGLPIVYYRNNHKGGFLRLSLVPVEQAMNHTAHRVNAFRTSCWSHGRVWCGRGVCGNDRKRSRYKQVVRVPPVFPDGEYVLGFVWYGGGYQQGDYYSCARVRVHGGVRLRATYRPVLTRTNKGRCFSTASAVGDCAVEPCTRKQYLREPAEWANGRRPRLIHAASINASLGPRPGDPTASASRRRKRPASRLAPWQRLQQARRRHAREGKARARARKREARRRAARRRWARAAERRRIARVQARRKAARLAESARVKRVEARRKAARIEARRRRKELELRRKQERADASKAWEEAKKSPADAPAKETDAPAKETDGAQDDDVPGKASEGSEENDETAKETDEADEGGGRTPKT